MHENSEADGSDNPREGRAGNRSDTKAFSSPKPRGSDNKEDLLDHYKSIRSGRKWVTSSPAALTSSCRRGRHQDYTKQRGGFLSYSPHEPASQSAQTRLPERGSTVQGGHKPKFIRHGNGFLSYSSAEPATGSTQLLVPESSLGFTSEFQARHKTIGT